MTKPATSDLLAGLIFICSLLVPAAADAGPPFRTDDPEPVELGHYEFYTFSTGTHVQGDTSGVLPGFEFNYGIIPNGMVHIVAPLAFDDASMTQPAVHIGPATGTPSSASNTGSSKRTRTVGARKLLSFRCLSCRLGVKSAD